MGEREGKGPTSSTCDCRCVTSGLLSFVPLLLDVCLLALSGEPSAFACTLPRSAQLAPMLLPPLLGGDFCFWAAPLLLE